jgi:hypothetical protein
MDNKMDLKPGETIRIRITEKLWYEVYHTGWVVEVTCVGPLSVKPISPNKVTIGYSGPELDDIY